MAADRAIHGRSDTCRGASDRALGRERKSMTVDGKQYIATTSGIVSGFFGGSGTSAVIVFALP